MKNSSTFEFSLRTWKLEKFRKIRTAEAQPKFNGSYKKACIVNGGHNEEIFEQKAHPAISKKLAPEFFFKVKA